MNETIMYLRVPGFPTYLMNEYGEIISMNTGSPLILRPSLNKKKDRRGSGYLYVRIKHGSGVYKNKEIHRMVAETFIKNKENKDQVNHIDGNTLNNHISNLEWCTRSENIQHAIHTLKHIPGVPGEKNVRSKLKENDIREIKRLTAIGMKRVDIGKLFGVKGHTISGIINGNTWKSLK